MLITEEQRILTSWPAIPDDGSLVVFKDDDRQIKIEATVIDTIWIEEDGELVVEVHLE